MKTKLKRLLVDLYRDLYYIDLEHNEIGNLLIDLSQINNIKDLRNYKKRRNADIRKGQSIRLKRGSNEIPESQHTPLFSTDVQKDKPEVQKEVKLPNKKQKVNLIISGKSKKHNVSYELTNRPTNESNNLELDDIRVFYIIWDDIIFEKDRIRFSPTRINEILRSVEYKGVFEELNNLKQEYFKRLYDIDVYKLSFKKNSLIVSHSPDWERIINTIDIGVQYFQFQTNLRSSFGPRLSTQAMTKLYNSVFDKNEYLKYLANIQEKEFKLIPIIESVNNQKEESFIFRIKSKRDNIIVIWENINKSRATHIFINTINTHDFDLQKLESFICTPMQVKRAHLYFNSENNVSLKKELKYLKSIRHINIESYSTEIQNLIEMA